MNDAFSIVRFSPDPEEVEYINVALLIWSGSTNSLVMDESFPKLSCMAPGFSASLMRDYLRAIHRKVCNSSVELAGREMQSYNSQFLAIGPRAIAGEFSESMIDILKHRYLTKPRAQRSTELAERHVARLGIRIDGVLGRMSIAPDHVLRRAAPSRFLSPDVALALGNHMRISRVINGDTSLIAIEALDLSDEHGIRMKAERFAYNYFRLGKISELLSRVEGRDLLRTTLTFGQPRGESAAFALEQARLNSDVVAPAEHVEAKDVSLLQRAASSLFALKP